MSKAMIELQKLHSVLTIQSGELIGFSLLSSLVVGPVRGSTSLANAKSQARASFSVSSPSRLHFLILEPEKLIG